MRKIFSLMLLSAAVFFSACSDDDDKDVLVEKVTLNESTLTIEIGKTETLVATVTPEDAIDKSVKWSSSDETIATVSAEGVVTALKASDTPVTITVTCVSDETKKAACAVTIKDAFMDKLVGTWRWEDVLVGGSTQNDPYEVTISKVDDNTINIYNVWTKGKTIQATLDREKKQIVIGADQLIYVHSTYGDITMVNYDEEETNKDKTIIGQYSDEGIEVGKWIAYSWSASGYFGIYTSSLVKVE